MKKLSMYALTAAAALAVTSVPVTAYAASGTYAALGNQKVVVIGGNIRKPDCGTYRPDNSLPDSEGSVDAYAAQVVKLVNEERAKAGLSPLTLQANVTGAADARVRELEASFSHTRPNGSHFSTALTEAGVQYRGAGENIAYGQKTPEQVMQGWMNSAGHRANILNASFTSIGVGHYRSAAGVDYWTQLFVQ